MDSSKCNQAWHDQRHNISHYLYIFCHFFNHAGLRRLLYTLGTCPRMSQLLWCLYNYVSCFDLTYFGEQSIHATAVRINFDMPSTPPLSNNSMLSNENINCKNTLAVLVNIKCIKKLMWLMWHVAGELWCVLLKMHSTRCTLQNMLLGCLTSVVTMVADKLKVQWLW